MNTSVAPFNAEREANAFRIWREGSSVNWDCTAPELADAVKLSLSTVYKICGERGWPVRAGDHGPNTPVFAVDAIFSRRRADHKRGMGYYDA